MNVHSIVATMVEEALSVNHLVREMRRSHGPTVLVQGSYWASMKLINSPITQITVLEGLVATDHEDVVACVMRPAPDGDLAVHKAIKEGSIELVVRRLAMLSTDCLLTPDGEGSSCAHLAATHVAGPEVMASLLAIRSTLVHTKDARGFLPLHLALVHEECDETVVVLLETWPFSATVRSIEAHGDLPAGCSPLLMAIKQRRSALVVEQIVMCNPATLLMVDTDGLLPIHVALLIGSSDETICTLIKYGMLHALLTMCAENMQGETALEMAVKGRHSYEVVMLLITATDAAARRFHEVLSNNAESEMMQDGIVFEQDEHGQPTSVRDSYVVDIDDSGEETGRELVHTAPQAQRLVEAMLASVSKLGPRLEDAVARRIIVHQLMTALYEPHERDGEMLAVFLGKFNTEAVYTDANNVTLLHIAAAHKSPVEVLAFILEQRPDVLRVADSSGSVALHYALANRYTLALLDHEIGGPWIEAVYGERPLVDEDYTEGEYRSRPKMEAVALLAQAWPDSARVANVDRLLPFDVMMTSNCPMNVVRLVHALNPDAVCNVGRSGNTPLHRACTHCNIRKCSLLRILKTGTPALLSSRNSSSRLRLIKFILNQDFEASHVKNTRGAFPLHFAVFYNCDPAVVAEVLHANEEAARYRDGNGDLPMHLALLWTNAVFVHTEEVIDVLLLAHVDNTSQNNEKHTLFRASLPLLRTTDDADIYSRCMRDYSTMCCLHSANSFNDRKALMSELLRRNPEALWTLDSKGQSPSDYMFDLVSSSMHTPFYLPTLVRNLDVIGIMAGYLKATCLHEPRALQEIRHITDLMHINEKRARDEGLLDNPKVCTVLSAGCQTMDIELSAMQSMLRQDNSQLSRTVRAQAQKITASVFRIGGVLQEPREALASLISARVQREKTASREEQAALAEQLGQELVSQDESSKKPPKPSRKSKYKAAARAAADLAAAEAKKLFEATQRERAKTEKLERRLREQASEAAARQQAIEAVENALRVESDEELQQAELRQAELQQAELRQAELQQAELQQAELRQAELQQAELQRLHEAECAKAKKTALKQARKTELKQARKAELETAAAFRLSMTAALRNMQGMLGGAPESVAACGPVSQPEAAILQERLLALQAEMDLLKSEKHLAQEHNECCMCLDAEKTMVFVPCGHKATCKQCAGEFGLSLTPPLYASPADDTPQQTTSSSRKRRYAPCAARP